MRQALFATALLAGMIYGSDGAASPNGHPETFSNEAVDVKIAAIDYCFAGSISDPVTGESVDLFVLCDEDGLEQNIDLA